jgi:uncharacterized membrane protein
MKTFVKFLQTTLVGGLLVLAPLYLIVLLLLKALAGARSLLEPIAMAIPAAATYPTPLALLVVIVACFLTGLALSTGPGRRAIESIQQGILEKIPGYHLVRALLARISEADSDDDGTSLLPALVEIEEALVPAIVVETLPDGEYVVLVPSVPTPMAGALYVLPAARVHLVDIPLKRLLRIYARWGEGTGEMVAAFQRGRAAKPA